MPASEFSCPQKYLCTVCIVVGVRYLANKFRQLVNEALLKFSFTRFLFPCKSHPSAVTLMRAIPVRLYLRFLLAHGDPRERVCVRVYGYVCVSACMRLCGGVAYPVAFWLATIETASYSHTRTFAAMPDMDAEQIENVNRLIEASGPILSRYEKVMKILKDANMTQTPTILPSQILCHPCNRAKLGLNPFEVHRVGKKVVDVGFSRDELRGAVCIEVHPDKTVSDEQYAFNAELISHSDGLLAPVSGRETYLSLGGGHMAAFLRAVDTGAKTSEPSLADECGCLNKQKIMRDEVLQEVLSSGYEWTVLSWKTQDRCPGLCDFIQRALNATNSIASECSELEVMSSISEFAEMQKRSGSKVDWASCCDAAISGNPRSAPYVSTLCALVEKYGGGPGAPVIHDLDSFAKQHSQNLVLGEEFLNCLVNISFGETAPCPRFRAACIATNLTSCRQSDGVSKLLLKTDLQKFAAKDKVDGVKNSNASSRAPKHSPNKS